MANRVYLDLGSNIEPEQNLPAAVELLTKLSNLLAVSQVWETKPLGMPEQPNFLNVGVLVETKLSAAEFKRTVISNIEQTLGRVRTENKNAPRTIDIDIILFNNDIFELDGRHIPNKELLERPFVAASLAEIAPDTKHPETGQTPREIAHSFNPADGDMLSRPDVSEALAKIKHKQIIDNTVMASGK